MQQIKKTDSRKTHNKKPFKLLKRDIKRLSNYKMEDYKNDVETKGLEETWNTICQFVIEHNDIAPDFLDISNFGELYEYGLAIQDKFSKKKSGQYYTPDDIAKVLSGWLYECKGKAVCDVACGTGKLILTYLDLIGYDKTRKLISSGNLYLYDLDHVALKICRTTIAIKYGLDIANSINDVYCDFLDSNISLPSDCKVISNPPYARISDVNGCWNQTAVTLESKELYSSFMEKIFDQSKSAVVITPYSFISGSKFKMLRMKMCSRGNGFIVSFDNVPGNIFCGRKHGVFNSNTANSVRAAVTVFNKSKSTFGFRVSPLIRFKNAERENLLINRVLEKELPDDYQIVSQENETFKKIDRNLVHIFKMWTEKSSFKVKDLVINEKSEYLIDMPNTCRYFTTASGRKLKRKGSITINIKDKEKYDFLYCVINSSFAYWWWRIYDGGITYSVELFNNMPLPYNLLSKEDKEFFANMTKKMMAEEDKYIIKKRNAGALQENIKFPEQYRNEINERILNILGFRLKGNIFERIHLNHFCNE